MTEVFEHKYMVFSIEDGPKVITEALNTYGAEGWSLTNMVTINAGEHLVAWLVKKTMIETPDPQTSKKNKISTLWTEESE